jgi:hypothetical protein
MKEEISMAIKTLTDTTTQKRDTEKAEKTTQKKDTEK